MSTRLLNEANSRIGSPTLAPISGFGLFSLKKADQLSNMNNSESAPVLFVMVILPLSFFVSVVSFPRFGSTVLNRKGTDIRARNY